MKNDYILLGLQEGATLEDAKNAYVYWKKKYQAADFDDEPEYAKRKIKALGIAYENVCRDIAGYVPEPVRVTDDRKETGKSVRGNRIKKLRRQEEDMEFYDNEPVAAAGFSGFIDGLKNAGAKFLEELDIEHGFIPKEAETDMDYDYNDED